jgi:hypothetical protein
MVAGWQQLGFDPFTAAMGQRDGFTPEMADHDRRQLRAAADTWRREGMADAAGLRWHEAGFGAKEARRLRDAGETPETAPGGHRGAG